MLPYLLCGLSVLLLIWACWKWLRIEDSTEPPELPGRLPLLGHALMILGDSVDMYNLVNNLSALSEKMGGVCRVHIGPAKFYAVSNPDDSLTVLNESNHKLYLYDVMKPFVGNGIFAADVATWKKNRKLLNPAFNQQVLDGFIGIFNTRAASLVERFADKLGKPFDHEHYLKITGLETIIATSFGVNSEECKDLEKNYSPLLSEIEQIFNTRMKTIWYHPAILYNLSCMKKKEDKLVKKLHEFSDTIIQKRFVVLKNSNFSSESNVSGKLKPFIDLLFDLSKDHPDMTDVQIRSEASTNIAAGHETSAVTLVYSLTLLGSYPRVQDKAYQEILEVMGDSNRFVDKEDLSKLVYIEAILKETLRLYPVGPLIGRYLDRDVKLNNYTLKAGHNVIVSLHGSGRHAMWGPDANEFRPERWFEDTLPPAKYFAPFGLGRRACIGKTYAMMAMKITLVHLLRNYTVSADVSKMVLKMNLLSSPHEGADIELNKRYKYLL